MLAENREDGLSWHWQSLFEEQREKGFGMEMKFSQSVSTDKQGACRGGRRRGFVLIRPNAARQLHPHHPDIESTFGCDKSPQRKINSDLAAWCPRTSEMYMGFNSQPAKIAGTILLKLMSFAIDFYDIFIKIRVRSVLIS